MLDVAPRVFTPFDQAFSLLMRTDLLGSPVGQSLDKKGKERVDSF